MSIEDVIARSYSDLSAKLREAADYVALHPIDVATRSLRAVSTSSGVSPATYSRLARALDFDSYEDLRELCRKNVGRRAKTFSEKAGMLRSSDQSITSILERQMAACISNIAQLRELETSAKLDQAVEALQGARNVILFGAFGSTGIVEYMSYLANYFSTNWTLAGRMGASLGSALASIGKGDVLLVVTKTPYAKRAILAAEIARKEGATTIVITDDHSCPALKHADINFIIPSDSPQFFSSYAATLVLMETLIAMLVARSSDDTSERIREVELRNKGLGEFWSD
ncbi:MurR/RpiR family transcriptional regulator [Thalassovita sp.]|uniref:MurR/RpiR family transcriptional regulator n=1 Tax=Thalassovita sp. TaxID=1979401 RepID=UPI0029DE5DF9|nr:MurR/RpiR family transcriptional regulator [Thalassovita sp.]